MKKSFAKNSLQENFGVLSETSNKAKSLSYPLNQWLEQLVTISQELIINKAKNYLNQKWEQEVIEPYQQFIAHRYPFDKTATQEVSLDTFAQFFSPQGRLENFFSEYLAPFMITQDSHWEFKKLNGLSLSLSDELLKQFIRAKLIRLILMPGDSKTPKIYFSLKPVAFEPVVKKVQLTLDDQTITDMQGSTKSNHLQWPGDTNNHSLQLAMTNVTGETLAATESGAWAWFKLLDKANLEKGADTQHYYLTFIINNTAAKYELIAETIVNPFIPGIINQFALPESLFS